MYNECCIVTCVSRRKDVSFHMFPKSEIGLKKWLQCINCERLRSLSFQELRKQFVCRNHFEKRFLSTTRDRVRLCRDAHPTLFTASEISSGIPHTDASMHNDSVSEPDHDPLKKRRHTDHTYCKPEVVEKHSKTDNIFVNEMKADVISSFLSMPSLSGFGNEVIKEEIAAHYADGTQFQEMDGGSGTRRSLDTPWRERSRSRCSQLSARPRSRTRSRGRSRRLLEREQALSQEQEPRRMEIDLQISKKRSLDHKNMIPVFNPSKKNQSVDIWLKKVNECAKVNGWDEKTVIHFAMQKLTGLGKTWYKSLNTKLFTWAEWQVKLMDAFPSEQNYGQILEEMLKRKTRPNESIEVYFNEKLALLNQCEITDKRAVDCIIHGIRDCTIRSSALTLRCEKPDQLLKFLLSNNKKLSIQQPPSRDRDINTLDYEHT